MFGLIWRILGLMMDPVLLDLDPIEAKRVGSRLVHCRKVLSDHL
jgi:hypothetical protein